MQILNLTQNYNTNFAASSRLSITVSSQCRMVLNALKDVNPDVQKLKNATNCSGAQKALADLKNLTGIDCIFKEGGLSFVLGDRNIKISVPDAYTLALRDQSVENRKDVKYVEIMHDSVKKTKGFDRKVSVEEFINSVFEKLDFPILQLRRFFKRDEIAAVLQKISPKAVLSEENKALTDSILNLFNENIELIGSVKNGVSRSKIKNGFYSVKPSTHGSKEIVFSNIGLNSTDYSVNTITIAAGATHLVIKPSKDGVALPNIIIDPKYRALKEKYLGRVYNLGHEPIFYTQQEIDSPMFTSHLVTVKKELEEYNSYLKEKTGRFNLHKSYCSTTEIGVIDAKTLSLISDIKQQFSNCKARMLKIKDAPGKREFKKKYNIETRMASPSLIFKDINEEGETAHLSFPLMAGEPCMKIIFEKQNGNIGRSLFVKGDKLAKFKATKLGSSKRRDTNSNYYTQAEIEESGLYEILQILKKRLSVVPKN